MDRVRAKERYRENYGLNWEKKAPDFSRCCEEVIRYIGNWPHHGQCARKRGYGPDGAYCKQHDPDVAAKRRAQVEARDNERFRKQRLEWAGPRFFAVLEKIANGHNDSRAIAQEAIANYVRTLPSHKEEGA